MLSFEDKIRIFNSYSELREGHIKHNKTNFYFDNSKVRKKVVARELGTNRAGYLFVGYLKEFESIKDKNGFINLDKHVKREEHLRQLIVRVINSLN